MPMKTLAKPAHPFRGWSDSTYEADPGVRLMLRVREDEPGAFAELMETWRMPLRARFLRVFHNVEEAEDLTQEVFLRLFRIRKKYQPTARFSTWLFRITQNLIRTAFDRKRKSPSARGGFETPMDRCIADADPALLFQREELSREVRSAVATLNGRQRRALEMFQFQNRSIAEIAGVLCMTPEAAKSLLFRARNHLRSVFMDGVIA